MALCKPGLSFQSLAPGLALSCQSLEPGLSLPAQFGTRAGSALPSLAPGLALSFQNFGCSSGSALPRFWLQLCLCPARFWLQLWLRPAQILAAGSHLFLWLRSNPSVSGCALSVPLPRFFTAEPTLVSLLCLGFFHQRNLLNKNKKNNQKSKVRCGIMSKGAAGIQEESSRSPSARGAGQGPAVGVGIPKWDQSERSTLQEARGVPESQALASLSPSLDPGVL
ncbi:hypothetical protein DV515_00019670 [Chloebia gouldiae]|uniref:Uncharacterized protein n=1 Tax=Chloebia gouldiae TaxID=44316 RepID=A0A3L8Q4N8_CHLGU|nr:hypothetical protein DV515_00019670 [Chloebia gouldiae]